MYKRRSLDEIKKIVAGIEGKIAEGFGLDQAIKKAGNSFHSSTYYNYKKRIDEESASKKPKIGKAKLHKYQAMEISPAESDDKVICVIGNARNIKNFIREL